MSQQSDPKSSTNVVDVEEQKLSHETSATSDGMPCTGEVEKEKDLLDADGENEIKYKTMHWWHVGALMFAETASLGVLSLPSAVAQLGLVPGVILIIGLGLLTTYGGYVIGQFKLHCPQVLNFADAGEILFGAFGRELFGNAAILSFIFVQAAHLLTFTVMMNVLTDHGTCSIIFSIIGFALSVVLSLPRTLKNVSYISVVSAASIFAAVIIVMISIGTKDHSDINIQYIVKDGDFTPIFIAVLDIMLAYAGNAAFFSFVSELEKPETFPYALFMLQGSAITFYTVVAAVIYYYAGPDVASPALGAASPLFRKIAYGIAIPTILVAGVINGHVAAKQIYIRVWASMKDPKVITARTPKAFLSWVGVVTATWLLAWILAEAIPVFNQLLGLMSAIFMSWFTYGITPMLWLYMNRGKQFNGVRNIALSILNFVMFLIALSSCAMGLYASGVEINKAAKNGSGKSFSCSGST